MDWTISNWSGIRGKYLESDRGYAGANGEHRGTQQQLDELIHKDETDPTIPTELGSMV